MLKLIFSVLIFTLLASPIYAADVTLRWDPTEGATGYKIQKSTDLGATWGTPVDVSNLTTYTYTGVEENLMVLFRASAYNAVGESIRTWSGAWYDHRLKPINSPSATGIQ